MKPVKNVTRPDVYKGVCSGFIYTFNRYLPCDRHVARRCTECPGQSDLTYTTDGITLSATFCTHGIKSWRIQ